MSRSASKSRTTKETDISISLLVDGEGNTDCATGLPFFDHMLDQLGRHSGMDLTVHATGDLQIDAHHTVEDTGILLGEVLKAALGTKVGVRRFASLRVPLDEAVVEAVLDLSGRPFLDYQIDSPGEKILGDPPFDPQLVEEFWRAFVVSSAIEDDNDAADDSGGGCGGGGGSGGGFVNVNVNLNLRGIEKL